jgi:hypothetical protein
MVETFFSLFTVNSLQLKEAPLYFGHKISNTCCGVFCIKDKEGLIPQVALSKVAVDGCIPVAKIYKIWQDCGPFICCCNGIDKTCVEA